MGKGDFRELTVEQAAAQLNVHPETVRGWCRKGILPHRRNRLLPGSPIVITQDDLGLFSKTMQGLT